MSEKREEWIVLRHRSKELIDALARAEAAEARAAELEAALVDATASLAAAISLLERTPKARNAAPSDTMFGIMLQDYRKSVERARAALRAPDA